MISINRSAIAASQLFNSAISKPPTNTLSSLSKISDIKNYGMDFSKLKPPAQQIDREQHKLQGELIRKNIAGDLLNNLKDAKFEKGIIKEIFTRLKEGSNISPEYKNVRLGYEVEKLYPHLSTSLDNIDRLVIFGDSLSDSKGRMHEKTYHIFPSYSQYYDGRFTNGFVWNEFLASPAFLKKEVVNFAEGGSTSASYSRFNILSNFLSNLETQMKNYQASSKDLAIVFAGANDYITLHQDNVLKVVEEQISQISNLLDNGVNNVLVMGMPELSLMPGSKLSDDKKEYADITAAHNFLLQRKVDELKEKYPEKKVFFFDTASAFDQVIRIARRIGYDTTHAYTTHGYIHNPIADDPPLNIAPKHVFNDSVHPTQEVHLAFATILNNFIAKAYSEKAQPS